MKYFPTKTTKIMFNKTTKKISSALAMAIVSISAHAQGVQGITAAESSLLAYVDPVASLCLVIGAVVGLIGGIRVYIKWNSGDQDINKELMGWGGSCLFLVLVSVIIKAFFGV
jgi:phage-related minor tail protein